MNQRTALRVIAVLIALRAMTNVLKPFGAGSGLVFFGVFLTGPEISYLGPVVGVTMLAMAWGYWSEKPWALPLGIAYVVYVAINLVGFYLSVGVPPEFSATAYFVFAVIALVVPSAAVWLLKRRLDAGPGQPSAS